jgi:hypothetical protein
MGATDENGAWGNNKHGEGRESQGGRREVDRQSMGAGCPVKSKPQKLAVLVSEQTPF